MLSLKYLPYRAKSWLRFFVEYRILKGKRVIDPRKFKIMTLPNYPQVDVNITCMSPEGSNSGCPPGGAFNLLPFEGKDVK